MIDDYTAANDAERARLDAMLERLSADDLGRKLANGLTIADVLVHLAFWDEYARSALEAYRDAGFSDSHTNFEAVNDAVLALSSAIPPAVSIEMVRNAAERCDALAASIAPELAETIEAGGKRRTLERAQHRRVHLGQIEVVLARAT